MTPFNHLYLTLFHHLYICLVIIYPSVLGRYQDIDENGVSIMYINKGIKNIFLCLVGLQGSSPCILFEEYIVVAFNEINYNKNNYRAKLNLTCRAKNALLVHKDILGRYRVLVDHFKGNLNILKSLIFAFFFFCYLFCFVAGLAYKRKKGSE